MDTLLQESFPELDPCIQEYLLGMLDDDTTVEDLTSSDDLFDLIGPFILNGCSDVKEGKVMKLCAAMYDTLNIPTSNSQQTILSAPIQISNMTIADTSQLSGNIWKATKGENSTIVNKQKLEKAEAKQREKAEKKLFNEANKKPPPKAVHNDSGTVQQAVNKKDQYLTAKSDIHINNFDLMYGEKKLLMDASLTINYGHRYGLVGRNGYGKSTLMNAIAKRELAVPPAVSLLHVAQEVEVYRG
ncbi:ATP-binding cassette sub-family F member 3-like [Bolinopsis microptera]|uniref:ATP-binding cassette sub-family F member 3-like n=1 Tax=Bolinopsis microptera TaxID=2820187 RepID=UPI003078AD40